MLDGRKAKAAVFNAGNFDIKVNSIITGFCMLDKRFGQEKAKLGRRNVLFSEQGIKRIDNDKIGVFGYFSRKGPGAPFGKRFATKIFGIDFLHVLGVTETEYRYNAWQFCKIDSFIRRNSKTFANMAGDTNCKHIEGKPKDDGIHVLTKEFSFVMPYWYMEEQFKKQLALPPGTQS